MGEPRQILDSTATAVQKTVAQRGLATPETPVLLMVSGGSDSTALAYLACELAERGSVGPLAMIHVNHGIRGADADEDQAFAARLAETLDLPFFACKVNVPALASARGENLEAVARHERYTAAGQALESLCRHVGAPVSSGRIFTAHTQDDRVENFYMRSIVGTGPGGFRSMRYLNGNVARPCLDVTREELRAYLHARREAGLAVVEDGDALWREDATNAHTDQFRAYVRHEIVPRAKARNERLSSTLSRTMNLIADEDDLMDEMAAAVVRDCVSWLCLEQAVNDEPAEGREPDAPEDGALFAPEFGAYPLPLRRRAALAVLQRMSGPEARIELATVEALLDAWRDGAPASGYTANIQGNLAVSANKRGVRLEPMEAYRARRKRL